MGTGESIPHLVVPVGRVALEHELGVADRSSCLFQNRAGGRHALMFLAVILRPAISSYAAMKQLWATRAYGWLVPWVADREPCTRCGTSRRSWAVAAEGLGPSHADMPSV